MAEQGQQEQSSTGNAPAAITKRDRARFLTQEVKANFREHRRQENDEQPSAQDEIFEDAAFDPQKVLQPQSEVVPKSTLSHRLSIGAKRAKTWLKNPKAASRNNYTRVAAAKIANHPHDQSTAFDDELLDAHDALTDAQEKYKLPSPVSPGAPPDTTSAVALDDAQSRLHRIEQRREDLKSGWILGRHVMRAKATRPIVAKPDRAQFYSEPAAPGQAPQLQTLRYIGHLVLWYTNSFTAHRIDDFDEPPFDLQELALTIERFAAVSTPWQSYYTKVRDIYRWDDPTRTAQIMVVYWVLWYFRHITTFAIGFIIYITIRNKFYPTTVEAVRDRVRRSRDQSEAVRAWGELIQKHGGHDWIEPLLDNIGPLLQMQMSDTAIFLERMQNFYRWERPQQTITTLCLLLSWFLFSLVMSLELCVRMFWMMMGCVFFYSYPIATNHPKYRHVVSPSSWLFWGTPDSAELAIGQLQEKVVVRDAVRAAALEQQEGAVSFPNGPRLENGDYSSISNDMAANVQTQESHSSLTHIPPLERVRATDRLTFKTILLPNHTPAHITLTRTHIILEPEENNPFSHPYSSLLELRKVDVTKDAPQTSTSSDTNNLTRASHIAKWLERAADVQLLPDGLGFVFLQQDSQGVGHLSNLQDGEVASGTRRHAGNTGTSPRPVQENPPHLKSPSNSTSATTSSSNNNRANKTEITVILNTSDRDKIFTVVLAWSNLKWQPLFSMNRQNKLGNRQTKGEGNSNLDDATKRALR